jgi:hypothetical protein
MDDYNLSAISEAKNEYSIRLTNILTPLLIEGIKSIFKEAVELCISNEETDKYLMTFQNFLTRVPKWNQTIIDQEAQRIVKKSGCNYLEDLITCVHISQLKILTSIRVSSKQKKIDITVPKIAAFIHTCYIKFARKLYSNVYLFESNIASLQMQKNNREAEIICKECILNAIRENVPVEKILRAYIDETIEEEEIIVEEKAEMVEDKEEPAVVAASAEDSVKEGSLKIEKTDKNVTDVVAGNVVDVAADNVVDVAAPDIADVAAPDIADVAAPAVALVNVVAPAINGADEVVAPVFSINTEEKASTLTFNDNDAVINYDKKDSSVAIKKATENTIVAPKTLERLEKISTQRHQERKDDEDGDDEGGDDEENEKIQILDNKVDLQLDELDVHVLDKELKLNNEILSDVEVLQ